MNKGIYEYISMFSFQKYFVLKFEYINLFWF